MPLEVLNQLAKKELDPLSDENFFLQQTDHFRDLFNKYQFQKIYRSSSNRCVSLEKYIRDLFPDVQLESVELPELGEIDFDIAELFPQDAPNLDEINDALYVHLLEGMQGTENLEKVIKRMNTVLNVIDKDESALVLSHGFFLRLLRAYLDNKCETNLLGIAHIERSPRLGYFEGFAMEPQSRTVLAPISLTFSNG